MVRQAVPLQPTEVHGEAEIHLQPVEDLMPNKVVTSREAHAGEGSWQDLRTNGKSSPSWSRFAGRSCGPAGDMCWSSLFLKDCTPWEGPMLKQFMKSCSPWEGPRLEQGQSVRSPPPGEEGAAETTRDELTTAPIPHPPAPLRGRR